MTTRLAAIFHHYNNVLGLRHQHDLPNVLAPFHVLMRFADLIEWKGAIDVGADPSFVHAAENLLSPQPDLLAFAPHVAEVQTEHALVPVHQTDRVVTRHFRE